jgi:NAD(P)H-dependent flavin oxidoreductase YrpB (nitropropane dioxygenase family)
MVSTPLCKLLDIRYPIIQGGMGPNDTTDLAAAVTNAGGLGMISNYRNGDTKKITREHIDKVKNLTEGTFGFNQPLAADSCQERIGAVLAARREDPEVRRRMRVVITSAGDPTPFVSAFKESGLLHGHVVPTVYHAVKAQRAGVDFIIAEGYESGGHVAYLPVHTLVLVPGVVDAVSIPVVAAGGICDARGFVAALALGAQGIQMGTRFYLTSDSRSTHPGIQQALLGARETDTVIVPGSYGENRHWNNPFTNTLMELKKRGGSKEEIAALKQQGQEAKMRGDAPNAGVPIGMVTGRIKEVSSVASVIEEIASGAEAALARIEKLIRA